MPAHYNCSHIVAVSESTFIENTKIPDQANSSNNSPKPERRTRNHSQPLQERPTGVTRCQSANATNSKHLLRGSGAHMTQLPLSDPQDPPRRLKNWFAPSSANGNQLPPRRKRSAIIPDKQSQPPAPLRSVIDNIPGLSLRPSSVESLFSGTNMAQEHKQADIRSPSYPSTTKIDDPTFYCLEVRLEHPLSLIEWHFRVTFTDLSTSLRPSVDFDDLSVRTNSYRTKAKD